MAHRAILVISLAVTLLVVGAPARADHISFASPPFDCDATSIHMWAPQFASAGFSDDLVMWIPEVLVWDPASGWRHYDYGDFAYQSLWGQGFSQFQYLDGSGVASVQTLPGVPSGGIFAVRDWAHCSGSHLRKRSPVVSFVGSWFCASPAHSGA